MVAQIVSGDLKVLGFQDPCSSLLPYDLNYIKLCMCESMQMLTIVISGRQEEGVFLYSFLYLPHFLQWIDVLSVIKGQN